MKLSKFDWLELVVFDLHIVQGGFDSAYLSYPPEFESAELQAVAADESQLHRLVLDQQAALEAWWDKNSTRGGALVQAHRLEVDRRKRAGNAA